MRRHELKILPKWYENVESSKKNFEIRRNDRDFKIGDTLILQEYEEGSYTGRQITRKIQYIYQGNGDYGLSEGYCILGLEQEPKIGHWILDETDNSITCDKCGCLIWANDISNGDAHYCPNCGCRMVEPKESEEKQEKTRDEKMIDAIDFAIKATDSQDDYSMGMRNGMRYVESLIDGKEPQYEFRWTDEEIKLEIDLGDEVVGDYGAKGVVVGVDTYKGEVLLSLLMRNHKVPQLVKASMYKTKTGRHFPQIIEVLEQIKGEADGK